MTPTHGFCIERANRNLAKVMWLSYGREANTSSSMNG